MYLRTSNKRNKDGSVNEYYQLASLRTSDIQRLETRRFLSFTILVEPMSSITFHWLTHRIEAYVRICVLALLVERVEEFGLLSILVGYPRCVGYASGD